MKFKLSITISFIAFGLLIFIYGNLQCNKNLVSYKLANPHPTQIDKIHEAISSSMSIDQAYTAIGKNNLLFDGRTWEKDGNSKFFKLHAVGNHEYSYILNKTNNYLIWMDSDRSFVPGRVLGIGIGWHNDLPNKPGYIYVEVENFNTER